MASRQQIEAIAQRVADEVSVEEGVEVVEVEYVKEHGDYYLRIFIDKPDGIGLDDCQRFSEAFSETFDVLDPIPGSYALEVSSPGVERPLKKPADYERFAGRTIKLKTYAAVHGAKRWTGVLQGLEDESVLLQVEKETVSIPLSMVAKARLVADFLPQGAKRS